MFILNIKNKKQNYFKIITQNLQVNLLLSQKNNIFNKFSTSQNNIFQYNKQINLIKMNQKRGSQKQKGINPQIFFENSKEPLLIGTCIRNLFENQDKKSINQDITNLIDEEVQNLKIINNNVQNQINKRYVSMIFDKQSGHLKLFSPDNLTMLQQQQLNLSQLEIFNKLPIFHADKCPAQALQQLLNNNQTFQYEIPKQNLVRLAACAIFIDQNDKVLLTKRSKGLRTFPGCWVVPGGRVDPGESIQSAMIRELQEEVGINLLNTKGELNQDSYQSRPIALYESVSPQLIQEGFPQYQNLVVFYIVKQISKENIRLKLQIDEVDQAAWVEDQDILQLITQSTQEKTIEETQKTIEMTLPQKSTKIQQQLSLLQGRYPNKYGEGIGEAHEKALFEYLAQKPELDQQIKNKLQKQQNK